MSANETQVGGTHYKQFKIQPWDFIKANNLDFFQGNIIAYVCRYRHKNGAEDLRKIIHYAEKMLEEYEQADSGSKPIYPMGGPKTPLTYLPNECGEWIKWQRGPVHTRTPTSREKQQGFMLMNGTTVHALMFEDGSAWDVVNGWRSAK